MSDNSVKKDSDIIHGVRRDVLLRECHAKVSFNARNAMHAIFDARDAEYLAGVMQWLKLSRPLAVAAPGDGTQYNPVAIAFLADNGNVLALTLSDDTSRFSLTVLVMPQAIVGSHLSGTEPAGLRRVFIRMANMANSLKIQAAASE